jgi:UDP-N-acetylglucosamine 2-epimerase (non-hydrolysing)
MKTIVTLTGIRPDFIRMSEIFKKLDQNFNHILVHTGQHYDKLLSDVFFDELEIRQPNYILNAGKESTNHFEQLSYLSVAIPKLFKDNNINPDLIIFLGDANTVAVSFPLKKDGYNICHIEAGMRSFDRRMLEEINRTVCDHCSDILFVYTEEYKQYLKNENVVNNVFVVGNTIVEPCNKFKDIMEKPKLKNLILVDIHRPENFKYPKRLERILNFANVCGDKLKLPVKILYFKRLKDALEENNISLGNIEMIDLMPYRKYLQISYDAKVVISDSGSSAEELPLLKTPLFYPRDYTERPQSYEYNCSIKYDVDNDNSEELFGWLEKYENGEIVPDVRWLGDGNTSELIIGHLKEYLG